MIFGKYPESVKVGENDIPVDTDFRIMVRFENSVRKSDSTEILSALSDFFKGNIPANYMAAADAAVSFYLCGKKPPENTENSQKNMKHCYDYDEDSRYFIAAFSQQYGIDLETASLHWWKFSALFAGLTDETELMKIMRIRCTEVSKINDKNERERIRKLQRRYALSEYRQKHYSSAAERDNDMINAAIRRMEALKRK